MRPFQWFLEWPKWISHEKVMSPRSWWRTYHYGLHKNIGISYYMVMFKVHYRLSQCLGTFHYFSPFLVFSNDLSSNPNRDRMQKLCPKEFDVPTYHFNVHNTICIWYFRAMLRVHFAWTHGVILSLNFSSWWDISNSILSDPTKDHLQKLCPHEGYVPNYNFGVDKMVDIYYSRVILW